MPDLLKLGFKDAGSVTSIRRVEYQGEIFEEGILESLVEAGRKNLTLVHVENGSLELRANAEPEWWRFRRVSWEPNRRTP